MNEVCLVKFSFLGHTAKKSFDVHEKEEKKARASIARTDGLIRTFGALQEWKKARVGNIRN